MLEALSDADLTALSEMMVHAQYKAEGAQDYARHCGHSTKIIARLTVSITEAYHLRREIRRIIEHRRAVRRHFH